MADFEGIKEIVHQVALQAAIAVMMTFGDIETGPWPAMTFISERCKG